MLIILILFHAIEFHAPEIHAEFKYALHFSDLEELCYHGKAWHN